MALTLPADFALRTSEVRPIVEDHLEARGCWASSGRCRTSLRSAEGPILPNTANQIHQAVLVKGPHGEVEVPLCALGAGSHSRDAMGMPPRGSRRVFAGH
jgi:hypothetical protein